MKRHIVEVDNNLNQNCIVECKLFPPIMVGSVKCQECKNCIDKEEVTNVWRGPTWIKCIKIKEAIG